MAEENHRHKPIKRNDVGVVFKKTDVSRILDDVRRIAFALTQLEGQESSTSARQLQNAYDAVERVQLSLKQLHRRTLIR